MRPNSAIKNVAQVFALLAIVSVAFLCLIAIPDDGNSAWIISLLTSKAIAAAGFYSAYKLEARWRRGNKLLKVYDDYHKQTDDTPNPMY